MQSSEHSHYYYDFLEKFQNCRDKKELKNIFYKMRGVYTSLNIDNAMSEFNDLKVVYGEASDRIILEDKNNDMHTLGALKACNSPVLHNYLETYNSKYDCDISVGDVKPDSNTLLKYKGLHRGMFDKIIEMGGGVGEDIINKHNEKYDDNLKCKDFFGDVEYGNRLLKCGYIGLSDVVFKGKEYRVFNDGSIGVLKDDKVIYSLLGEDVYRSVHSMNGTIEDMDNIKFGGFTRTPMGINKANYLLRIRAYKESIERFAMGELPVNLATVESVYDKLQIICRYEIENDINIEKKELYVRDEFIKSIGMDYGAITRREFEYDKVGDYGFIREVTRKISHTDRRIENGESCSDGGSGELCVYSIDDEKRDYLSESDLVAARPIEEVLEGIQKMDEAAGKVKGLSL